MTKLTRSEIEVLLESFAYSIQRISEGEGTPYQVRQDNLRHMTSVQDKLRKMKGETQESVVSG